MTTFQIPVGSIQVPLTDVTAQYLAVQSDLLAALPGVLEERDVVLGPNVRAFEAEFASYCDTRYAVGVGSGTDALVLALKACGVQPGDEVITAAYAPFATAAAVVQIGAVPVFVDVDPDTFTLSPALLPAAMTDRTRAIVPVHLAGQMAQMDAIVEVAARDGVAVIEDACQAPGAEARGWRAGSFGDAGVFSFGPRSSLSTYGEAGAVTTNSRALAEQVRLLREHGRAGPHQHTEVGTNSRLDEIHAAILRVKLRLLDGWNERRRAHASTYRRMLTGLDVVPPMARKGTKPVYHRYIVQLDEHVRDEVQQRLASHGVESIPCYPVAPYQQPAMQGVSRTAGPLPVTESLSRRTLALPMYPELVGQQLAYVVTCLAARPRRAA